MAWTQVKIRGWEGKGRQYDREVFSYGVGLYCCVQGKREAKIGVWMEG